MNDDVQISVGAYANLLNDIKNRVRSAQTRAVLAVNAELLQLYWQVGQLIENRQQQQGYGTSVVPRLARDLQTELPEVKGFSARNINRMLAFYREYSRLDLAESPTRDSGSLLPQPVAKAGEEVVPQPVAQLPASLVLSIPWGHHAELMARIKDLSTRRWYMESIIRNGWSRSTLVMHIETQAHQRQGNATSNFALRMPQADSDLAQQALKDPYIFDFLTLDTGFRERELEGGLIAHLEKFLLELGQGFAFVGRQYHLDIGDQDFYIDLLFYHLELRCYVVIDLKRGDFKPEYAGKMNFYCSVVDEQLRHESDKPTIGLILCQQPNRILAEYALRGMDKPIGVSGFELTRALPTDLQSSLPTIEELERELQGGAE